ncbi:MAG: acyl-CoA synthetase [Ilumatobacteraceae bacterium]
MSEMGEQPPGLANPYRPGAHATNRGDRPAVIMASGVVVTYAELEERSRRYAHLLRSAGLRPGDHVAVLMENHPRYLEVFWGAQRCGLYTTPINWHLKADEAGYIVEDCGAVAVVSSAQLADVAQGLEPFLGNVRVRLMIDGVAPGWDSYESTVARQPAEEVPDEVEGSWMFYSSGTTGRPKGIMPSRPPEPFGATGGPLSALMQGMYGFGPDSVYLCPAPLYHAAPLGWTTTAQRIGATVVVMDRFDAETALALVERHRITHAQFVPTHFIRMLKLPDDVRHRYDLSSLTTVIHAAAPCPIAAKRAMLDWWGPVIHEYYAGSEGNGFCAIGPDEWLAHPGSVGKPITAVVHVLDEDHREVPAGEDGQIWFESPARFTYHNDPDKTAAAFDEHGWSSLGDIGRVDEEGYLYLTDRVSHMIISGGVNIYPQEIEDLLAMHAEVADVAVVGVPNADLGEEVKAVVIASAGATAGAELAARLIAYCREHLAHYKCPVSVDFVDDLPRLPTGKLLKRELRHRYWPPGP